MKKLPALLALLQLVWFVPIAQAAITVTNGPTTMVNTPITAPASSAPIPLFKFSLNQDAGETLSGVTVIINKNGTNNLISSDLASLAVYKDNGDAVFNTASDLLAGSQTTVNVDSPTTINTSANNTLTGGATFFVTINTDATWNDTAPVDSFTATLGANGIITSSNSPTVTVVTTGAITADTTGPVLTNVVAKNTGGTSAKEAGDSVQFTFNEVTTKPFITVSTLPTTFVLSNGHSFLDGLGVIMSSSWNTSGTVYTITLSSNNSLPTVEPGDNVTMGGNLIKDSTGNVATGNQIISGSFITNIADTTGPIITSAVAQNTGGTSAKEAGDSVRFTFGEATNKPNITDSNINSILTLNNSHSWLDGTGHIGSATWNTSGTVLTLSLSAGTLVPTVSIGDTVTMSGSVIQDVLGNNATGSQTITGSFGATSTPSGDEEHDNKICTNSLINGRLYKVTGNDTIYLAASCRLKIFKGKSWGHAKGKKFRNVITLSSLDGITVQQPKPAKTEKHDKVKESDDNERGQSGNLGVNSNEHGNSKAKGRGRD
jgi:hypothetical protein